MVYNISMYHLSLRYIENKIFSRDKRKRQIASTYTAPTQGIKLFPVTH